MAPKREHGNLQYCVFITVSPSQAKLCAYIFAFCLCDGFCEASVSTNCGSVIVNQQLVWIPELKYLSKDKMGSITDEKRQ
jgi:hypothetical protein